MKFCRTFKGSELTCFRGKAATVIQNTCTSPACGHSNHINMCMNGDGDSDSDEFDNDMRLILLLLLNIRL